MLNHAPDPLASLREIHLPAPITWWPLAWGWLVLFCFLVFLSGLTLFYARRHYQRGRARREALRCLMHYEKEYQQGVSGQILSAHVSELLRRLALVYFPRKEIASLQGELWLAFLNKTGKGINFEDVRESLLVLPYQPEHAADLHLLFVYAKRWIKQRRGPCLN